MTRQLPGPLAALPVDAPALATQTDLTIGLHLEPPHLDPTSAAAGAIDSVLCANAFDGLTCTFTLRPGVTVHNATTMDGEDVEFTLDRVRADDSANAPKALCNDISDVSLLDPQTVRLPLTQPNGALPFDLAWGNAVVVAPESIDTIKTAPIGTGPVRCGNGCRAIASTSWHTPLSGRHTGVHGGHVQGHLGPDRRLRRDDGAGHRHRRRLPHAGNPAAGPGRSALPGPHRRDRGQDNPGNAQHTAPLRQCRGARRRRPCHHPPGHHPRCDVRPRHLDRTHFAPHDTDRLGLTARSPFDPE